MKRRFADGDFRGALELAEELLLQRPDDDVAEAIALASRAELAAPSGMTAVPPPSFLPDSTPLETPRSAPVSFDATPLSAPLTDSAPTSAPPAESNLPAAARPSEPPSDQAHDTAPPSAYDIEVEVEELDPAELERPTREMNRPDLLAQLRTGGNARPTLPPRFSPSTPPLPLELTPAPTPVAPPANGGRPSVPPGFTEHLDDAWEQDGGGEVVAPPPSSNTLVLGLERIGEAGPLQPVREDRDARLAREMYDLFVGGRFHEALRAAQKVLAFHPSEPLAQAIQAESKVALRRAKAIVVLVAPPAELAARAFDARAQSVLTWVDGTRSVEEIAQASGLSLPATLAVLDELRAEGALVLSALEE